MINGLNIYCIDYSIGARKTNFVTVMIIIHIAYITCLVPNDVWHAYDVIVVYKLHDGASRISHFAEPAILWLAGRSWARSGLVTFSGASNTVVGKHGYGRYRAHNRGHTPWPKAKIIGQQEHGRKIILY